MKLARCRVCKTKFTSRQSAVCQACSHAQEILSKAARGSIVHQQMRDQGMVHMDVERFQDWLAQQEAY